MLLSCPMSIIRLKKHWINIQLWRRNNADNPFSLKVETMSKSRCWNDIAYSTWIQRCVTICSTFIRLANAMP